MKITILWSSLASYSVAFFKELVQSEGCDIQIIYFDPTPEAPYDKYDLSFCTEAISRDKCQDFSITSAVDNFCPDYILMCSWNYYDYMKIARRHGRKGVFVGSTIDHQWEGTLKQWLGVITTRLFLKPSIDCFLVAGDRQAHFAQKLGYENSLYGLYSAIVEDFESTVPLKKRDSSFLFVGRLSTEKGIVNLIDAYRMYRRQCPFPWDLKIAGTGKLQTLLNDTPGVKSFGFVQPVDLPSMMQNARALILPSIWEPWGVVIHEAAASGLPVIATNVCGAITMFVRDGINGLIVPPIPHALKDAMLKLSLYQPEKLQHLGNASHILACLWTPRKLANYFVENLKLKNKSNNK
jgi:glycosyltransferase involved in cell wall biosynthesis